MQEQQDTRVAVSRTPVDIGVGFASGVALLLLSTFVGIGASAASTLGLAAIGGAAGAILHLAARRPLITLIAAITIWLVLWTSPIYPFPIHPPAGGRHSWEIGDMGMLSMLTGLLIFWSIRAFREVAIEARTAGTGAIE